MNIHDELVILRHTMAALRSELEYIKMCANDYTVNELPYVILDAHRKMTDVGMALKLREGQLLQQLEQE